MGIHFLFFFKSRFRQIFYSVVKRLISDTIVDSPDYIVDHHYFYSSHISKFSVERAFSYLPVNIIIGLFVANHLSYGWIDALISMKYKTLR